MPARDNIHFAILRALVKYGLSVMHDPLTLRFDAARVFVDVAGEFEVRQIAVEIKSFAGASAIHELECALGQMLTSKTASAMSETPREIFLPIPLAALPIFESELTTEVRRRYDINVIVVDIEKEEVTQWLEAKNLKP